jgi:phenylacetate-CoA ligase
VSQSRLEALYERLPVSLQNVVCCYYGWAQARTRFSRVFEDRLSSLVASERWSRCDIDAYQDSTIERLVRHSYLTVPYYRRKLDEAGVVPSDIRTRADLPKLPLLKKEDVRRNIDLMISSTADRRRLVQRRTSGTTGKSLSFLVSKEAIAFQWAVWWRHRMRFGLSIEDWHVNFTGKLAVPASQNRPPYWRWNPAMHQVIVNMHHLTPLRVPDIVDFLNERTFAFYSGYPSVIHALALASGEASVELEKPPKVIVTGAENVLAHQRNDIEAFTGAQITDQYGLSEGTGNASQCREGRYHEDFEFGILECLDPSPQGNGTVRGRIVGTGFACPQVPFLRYDTGDTGIWTVDEMPCGCGRSSRSLAAIEGRVDDYVVTPEGRRIMRFDYIFKTSSNVRECQVVQYRHGAITLRISARPGYSSRDEDGLRSAVGRWISPQLEVEFEYVDEIERSSSGKFRAVESRIGR